MSAFLLFRAECEGSSFNVYANELSLNTPVWREGVGMSLDDNDEEIIVRSRTEYVTFDDYWNKFTESEFWLFFIPHVIHPMLNELVRTSLNAYPQQISSKPLSIRRRANDQSLRWLDVLDFLVGPIE